MGDQVISSTTERSEKVKNLNTCFKHCLELVLSSAFWTFATKRTELAPDTTSPDFGYGYRFSLPSDYLRIDKQYLQTNNNQYKREGKYFLSDSPTFKILYIYRNENFAEYSRLFVEAVGCYIAYHLTPVTDKQKSSELLGVYRLKRADALQVDSSEDNYNRDDQLTEWEEAFYY